MSAVIHLDEYKPYEDLRSPVAESRILITAHLSNNPWKAVCTCIITWIWIYR